MLVGISIVQWICVVISTVGAAISRWDCPPVKETTKACWYTLFITFLLATAIFHCAWVVLLLS